MLRYVGILVQPFESCQFAKLSPKTGQARDFAQHGEVFRMFHRLIFGALFTNRHCSPSSIEGNLSSHLYTIGAELLSSLKRTPFYSIYHD